MTTILDTLAARVAWASAYNHATEHALVSNVAAKGVGTRRWKPNIKWGRDRGKNPPGSPWGEDRDNHKHLTLAEKRAAREES